MRPEGRLSFTLTELHFRHKPALERLQSRPEVQRRIGRIVDVRRELDSGVLTIETDGEFAGIAGLVPSGALDGTALELVCALVEELEGRGPELRRWAHKRGMPNSHRIRGLAAAVLLFAAAVVPGVLHAQSGPTRVPVGTRVRLTLRDSLRQSPFERRVTLLVGQLVGTSGDTLFVTPPGAVSPAAVPLSVVRRIERSRGASRVRSALILGLLVGGEGSAVAIASQPWDRSDRWSGFRWGAVAAGAGALLGAVLPFESWKRVRP